VLELIPTELHALWALMQKCLSPVAIGMGATMDINPDKMWRMFKIYGIPRQYWQEIDQALGEMFAVFTKFQDAKGGVTFTEADLKLFEEIHG